jgi:gliding motility-associated-like protein
MTKKITLSILLVLMISCFAFGQADIEFWFVAPEVDAGHGDDPIFLRLTAENQAAIVTIGQPANLGGVTLTQTIPANTTVSINLTPFKALLENQPANTVLAKGIQIQSTNPITAYYEVANASNPEIFPLKGSSALGQFFYLPGQNTFGNQLGTPAFDIVATENNTTITIIPTDPLIGRAANISFTITLNAGETYSCVGTNTTATGTLAGSKITSNKPIAVTHSDDSLFNNGAWDLIGDQIVPVNILGTEYIAVKGLGTNERVYIVATENNTTYYLNGNSGSTVNINAGQIQSYAITGNAVYITSDKPIYVLHLSGNGRELADALLPPIGCTGSDKVGFVRTAGSGLFTVMVATTVGNEGNFLVNGSAAPLQASNFFAIPGNPNWVGARVNLTNGQAPTGNNIIENTSGLFHLGILNQLGVSSEYGYFSSYSTLNLGSDRTICITDAPLQLDGGSNSSSFLWNDGSTNRFLNASQSGEYSVQTTLYNCISTDTITVTFQTPPTITIRSDTSLCPNEMTDISATVPNMQSIVWSNGSTDTTQTISVTGMYVAILTDSVYCVVEDSVYVDFYPNPYVELGNDTVICDGNLITLIADVSSVGTFLWSDGSTDGSLGVGTVGIYSVDILDENGCAALDSVFVDVLTSLVPNLPTDTTICQDIILRINAYQPTVETYLWMGESAFYNQNEVTDSVFIITYPGFYTLEMTNQCGGLTQYLEVKKEDCTCEPFIPNVFTPNGDGRNDKFQVFANCEFQDFKIEIYDRWGTRLFVAADWLGGWDGTARGQELPPGVYIYKIEYTAGDKNGNPTTTTKQGSITLIR